MKEDHIHSAHTATSLVAIPLSLLYADRITPKKGEMAGELRVWEGRNPPPLSSSGFDVLSNILSVPLKANALKIKPVFLILLC